VAFSSSRVLYVLVAGCIRDLEGVIMEWDEEEERLVAEQDKTDELYEWCSMMFEDDILSTGHRIGVAQIPWSKLLLVEDDGRPYVSLFIDDIAFACELPFVMARYADEEYEIIAYPDVKYITCRWDVVITSLLDIVASFGEKTIDVFLAEARSVIPLD
jgi:hypothetical protein